jgi:endonuclease/exonuclease/phosphatase family metal-dependent hydrolase
MPRITVTTFNVHFGERTKEIADAIKNNSNLSRSSVILLQEVESYKHEGKHRAEKIAAHLGMEYSYVPARNIDNEDDTHGLAILSKYPILSTEVVNLEYFRLGLVSRTRIAQNAEIQIGGTEVLFSNLHLDTRLNFPDRATQINSIVAKLKSHRINKVLIGGDLNTMPFVWARRTVPVFYSNQRRRMDDFMSVHGFENQLYKIGHTLKQGIVRFSLDAFYSRGIKVLDFGVERSVKVSDHKPVWVDIEI